LEAGFFAPTCVLVEVVLLVCAAPEPLDELLPPQPATRTAKADAARRLRAAITSVRRIDRTPIIAETPTTQP
jgi:hypothetical protein